MSLSIIVAMTRDHAIGVANTLPWHLSEDLQHFKRVTLGCPVVMGRKTYESIGRPLPGRLNIVISRSEHFQAAGCERSASLQEALKLAQLAADGKEYFVIGGGDIYTQALPYAQRLYVTWVEADMDGDTYFPDVDWSQWTCNSNEQYPVIEGREYAFEICSYKSNKLA